jgi:hypothetical protein
MREEYSADIYYPEVFVSNFIDNLLAFVFYTASFHSACAKAQSAKISPMLIKSGLAVPARSECGL